MKDLGAREGGPYDRYAQTPGPKRATVEGRACTEDTGSVAAGTDPRQLPTAGAKLGSEGRAGEEEPRNNRGLRAGEGQDAWERAPCGRLQPRPSPRVC